MLVELPPLPLPAAPATTVIAAAAAPLFAVELAVPLLPPPEPARTVTAFPAAVTVGDATRASAVNLAESTGGGAADDDFAAASTPGAGAPPALTVIAAGAAAALAPLGADNTAVDVELPPWTTSVIVPSAAEAVDFTASTAAAVEFPPTTTSVIVPRVGAVAFFCVSMDIEVGEVVLTFPPPPARGGCVV